MDLCLLIVKDKKLTLKGLTETKIKNVNFSRIIIIIQFKLKFANFFEN
jgi:hypothetical protein